MSIAMHTPTPWNVTRDENDARALIRDGNFMRVAECGRAFVPGIAEANAAFIVRAVNAHDDLVAALRPFASLLRHFDGRALSRPKKGPIHSWSSGDIDGGEPEALTVEMLRAAAAALAKAEGGAA